MSEREEEHAHAHAHEHDRLVALFDRLIDIAERRFGMKATTAVALMHALEAREQLVRQIVKGIWTALVTLIASAIGVLLVLGVRGWINGPQPPL